MQVNEHEFNEHLENNKESVTIIEETHFPKDGDGYHKVWYMDYDRKIKIGYISYWNKNLTYTIC